MRVPSTIETINDAQLFQPWFSGPSWDAWRTVFKGAYALPMTDAEQQLFRVLAEREPPRKPVRELWCCCGRRAGKDSAASVSAGHTAAFFDPRGRLRPGERASVLCLACDREQAKIVLGYVKSYFAEIPYLRRMVANETANGLELSNGVDIVVATNDFRSVRGKAVLLAIFDECAFWRDDRSEAPDRETYAAIVPGTMTLGGMIIGISSPHRKSGLLYERWKEHFGRDESDVLVIRAPSATMNPTLDAKQIAAEIDRDPAVGKAEWLAEWRDDLAAFLDPALIEQAVDRDVVVRPRIPKVKYFCMIDPSGGVGDSMTLGISHREIDGRVLLDCIVERPAPFQAQQVVADFSRVMREYGLNSCVSDRYAASWVSQAFASNGITVIYSARDRSEIYADVLPLFTSGKVRLLDNKRLVDQFAALERKTTATRDRIDHPAHGAKDDVCNSAAGSIVLAADRSRDVPCVNPILFDLRTGVSLNPAANWSTDRGYARGSNGYFGDHPGW